MVTDDPKHLQRQPKAVVKATCCGLLSLGALIAVYHVVTGGRDEHQTVVLLGAVVSVFFLGLLGVFSSLHVVHVFHDIGLVVGLALGTVPLMLIFTGGPSRTEPDESPTITSSSTTTTTLALGTTVVPAAPTTETTGTTVAETVPQSAPSQIQWVTSPAKGPTLCLHAPSATPGTRVVTARCDGSATRWVFVSSEIRGPGNSCLTASGDPIENYTPVEIQPCGFAAHQSWNVVREDAEIRNTAGGCLDAGRRPEDEERGEGSLVQMWGRCENSPEENWLFL